MNNQHPKKVIVIDGIISAGKTEYINMLKQDITEYKIYLVKEPVDKWLECGILERFYNDPKRWAYHFQTKAFHDRITENIRVYKEYLQSGPHDKPALFLLERSPYTDNLFIEMLYDTKVIDDMEMANYREWWHLWYQILPYKIDAFIYLSADIDTSMKRIEERHRQGESRITRDYQDKLKLKHDELFKEPYLNLSDNNIKVPVFRIRNNDDYRTDSQLREKLVIQFLSYVNSL